MVAVYSRPLSVSVKTGHCGSRSASSKIDIALPQTQSQFLSNADRDMQNAPV